MTQKTEVHFITGKGGVGKSTFAAALCKTLADTNEGPILLIDIQGSGRALEMCGQNEKSFTPISLPEINNAWGCRILPRETFRQYFGILLTIGNFNSSFAEATAGIRERLVDLVLGNKVVSSFVDICPGLEPAILLGKIHWESTSGFCEDMGQRWRHVVVDAPATGHGLMLFRSMQGMTEVFGSGVIFKQANEIMSWVRDSKLFHVYVVSTPEELPLKESQEIVSQLSQMKISDSQLVLNRIPVDLRFPFSKKLTEDVEHSSLSSEWKKELLFEQQAREQKITLLKNISPNFQIPELFVTAPKQNFLSLLCDAMAESKSP